jgi:hypothetical protein
MAVEDYKGLALIDLWGNPLSLDSTQVSGIDSLPSPQRFMGIIGSKITVGGVDYFVRGNQSSVFLAVVTAQQQAGGQFDPVLVVIGGAVGTLQGHGTYWRERNEVVMAFQFLYNPNAGGATEEIKFSLPIAPTPNPFGATTQLTGSASINGSTAAAFCPLGPQAKVGEINGSLSVNLTDVDTLIGVVARYTVAVLT